MTPLKTRSKTIEWQDRRAAGLTADIRHNPDISIDPLRSAVPPQTESIVPLPNLPAAGSGVIVSMALAKTPGFLASRCKTASFAVLFAQNVSDVQYSF